MRPLEAARCSGRECAPGRLLEKIPLVRSLIVLLLRNVKNLEERAII